MRYAAATRRRHRRLKGEARRLRDKLCTSSVKGLMQSLPVAHWPEGRICLRKRKVRCVINKTLTEMVKVLIMQDAICLFCDGTNREPADAFESAAIYKGDMNVDG